VFSGIVSPWHIAIFVVVVALLFGPRRVPEIARSLGKGMREVRGHLDEVNPMSELRALGPAPPETDEAKTRPTPPTLTDQLAELNPMTHVKRQVAALNPLQGDPPNREDV
jgi:sec-independent protein translocase protein TatA